MRLFRSPHAIVLSSCFVIIHAALFAVYGFRTLYDSVIYIKSADYLLEHGSFEEAYYFFYSVPVALIALCRFLFPGELLPFLVLQITISGVAMVYLYKASEKIFQSSVAASLSVVAFLVWWDNLHWNSTIMTESVFCSLICFLIYRLVVFDNSRADWIFVLVLSLTIVFTRPTGILIVIAAGVFILCYYWKSLPPWLRPTIIGGCILVAILGAYTMFSIWDFTDQYHKGNIVTYADVAAKKNLNYDGLRVDPGYVPSEHSKDHSMIKMLRYGISNPLLFLKAAGMKIGYLLSATRPYYSWQHNLFSLTWLAFVYTLFYFGYRRVKSIPLKFCIATIIILNCVLVGISSIDWDNRFYIPMFPCIALMAGGGGAFLYSQISSLRRR